MAGPVEGNRLYSIRKRVFVLVADGTVQGVFTSWDAAEAFAEQKSLPLDHLLEYETSRGDPEHLHLMAIMWEDSWVFHGKWPKSSPSWPYPPKKVRLDHYHQKEDEFTLFRQKEFDWQSDLFLKINPMAPDHALVIKAPTVKPIEPQESKPTRESLTPEGFADQPPKPQEPRSPTTEEDKKPESTTPPGLQKKPELKLSSQTGAKTGQTDAPKPREEIPDKPISRPSFQKRSSLKLKSKKGPQPIPSFQPTVSAVDESSASSVELAQQDPAAAPRPKPGEVALAGTNHKVWSLRLIFTVLGILLCWSGGLFWVFRPKPTATNLVAEIITLNEASKIVLEPDMVFFQLPVDPMHQERWIESLGMQPIRVDAPLTIPTYHTLSMWEQPNKYIRPPYALVEVDEWWMLKQRTVRHGFRLNREDGSIFILDLESDMLIGWSKVKHLSELMN